LSTIEKGDTVKVHYTGKLNDGSVFDSSEDREPLEFTLGGGQLIPGFEKAVNGMEVGDSTTVDIPVDEAYGKRRDELELEVSKAELPGDAEPEVGMQLQMKQQGSERTIPVRITEVEEEKVTIDANHPLAGKDLTFDIEVVEKA
jgi:peptidylprolyl isomerase